MSVVSNNNNKRVDIGYIVFGMLLVLLYNEFFHVINGLGKLLIQFIPEHAIILIIIICAIKIGIFVLLFPFNKLGNKENRINFYLVLLIVLFILTLVLPRIEAERYVRIVSDNASNTELFHSSIGFFHLKNSLFSTILNILFFMIYFFYWNRVQRSRT